MDSLTNNCYNKDFLNRGNGGHDVVDGGSAYWLTGGVSDRRTSIDGGLEWFQGQGRLRLGYWAWHGLAVLPYLVFVTWFWPSSWTFGLVLVLVRWACLLGLLVFFFTFKSVSDSPSVQGKVICQ